MKKNISNLLDAYGDPNVDFERGTPLSSERIKELTMRKINKEAAPKTRRITFHVLIAAAIIVTLAVSAFAAEIGATWFQQFFADEYGTELSEAQIAYIEENALPINESKTVDGYTLNVESVLNDAKTFYIKLNLYAPEGVEILDSEYFSFEQMSLLVHGEEQPWEQWGYSQLYDENKKDNHLSIIMQIRFAEDTDTNFLLTGGGVTLRITNLSKSYGFYFDRKTEQLAEGTWQFDLHFATTQEDLWERELISEPVPCMMVKDLTKEETEIFLTSVCLRALTTDVVYDYPDGADLERLYWRGMKVIKKDGTSVNVMPSDGSIQPTDTQVTGYMSFETEAPIVLDEVAYIEFPGGAQIPVNNEE